MQKLNEKSRECNKQHLQPTHDSKRKRQKVTNARYTNAQPQEANRLTLFLFRSPSKSFSVAVYSNKQK